MADEPPKPKRVWWIGSCREDLRDFPEDVKYEIGTALRAAQHRRPHPALKVMKGFGGATVWEVRADDVGGTFRLVYTVEFPEVIAALHSFQKKSKRGIQTPKEEMQRVKRRLAEAKELYEQHRKQKQDNGDAR
jgi:phage-related protein